jgi:hypothetical protein
VATRLAEADDEGGPFRMDLPPLLARAGRKEAAAAQAEANLTPLRRIRGWRSVPPRPTP